RSRPRVHRVRARGPPGDRRRRADRGAAGAAVTAALEVRELRREFGGIQALAGVTLSVQAGERLAVIGPNGAGKTTFFNVLTGEIPPTSGAVVLEGRDVTAMSAPRRARQGLARMYQKSELFDG